MCVGEISLDIVNMANMQANTLDNLELHLTTCETYECEECEFVTKYIPEIKNYILERRNVPLATFVISKYTETMKK